jgi:Tfp pilus assembly protein PilF
MRAGGSRLLSVYGSSTNQLESVDTAVRWNASDWSAHHSRALVLLDLGQEKEALAEMQRAVELRRDDYYLWLELGHVRETTGDLSGAGIAFREAVRLAPDYAQPHWQLGNFILRTGESDAAFIELRRAVASDETLFPAVMDLAWGAYEGDARLVLQAAQPQTDAACIALARFFAAHHKVPDAMTLFRKVSGNNLDDERGALVNELLAGGNFPEAHEVWSTKSSHKQLDAAIVFDGGFEREIDANERAFGWKPFPGSETVRFSVDSIGARSGGRSLRIDYAGNFAPDTPAISQLVLIKPLTRYRLRFAARTDSLVTAALPIVAISTASDNKIVLVQSDSLMRGTNEWSDFEIEFTTLSDMRTIVISIQRHKCDSSPCPIFGRAWFDSFQLEEF